MLPLIARAVVNGAKAAPMYRGFAAQAAPAQAQRVVLIFGASGGVGSALASKLAQDDKITLLLADRQLDNLKKLQEQLPKGRVNVEQVDASQPEQVEQLVQKVVSTHKKLDAVASLVGNVKMDGPNTGNQQDDARKALASLKNTIDINLVTAFNVLHSSAKAMAKSGGGNIVLTSAAVAETGVPGFEAMSAAKAGVEGLVRSTAATYVRDGVRVNAVAPGLTHTGQTESMMHGKPSDTSKAMHPVKHVAEPNDVACALAFLLNPGTDFITGQVLAVDGGLSTLSPRN